VTPLICYPFAGLSPTKIRGETLRLKWCGFTRESIRRLDLTFVTGIRTISQKQIVMKNKKIRTFAGVPVFLLLLIIAGASPVFAQQNNQQQTQQMRQQMQQQMNQKMDDMLERTRNMSQQMNRKMGQAKNEQMRNQYRMMNRFSEQMGMTLGNMKNAAERCDLMLNDPEMMRDQDMKQEMERMQRHLFDMTTEMEDAIQTMDQMAKRLGTRQSN
jgi:hypothetical protein